MKKELKIGIFAVTVLAVSFFVLNYLRGEDIFNREAEYVSSYSNVEGLVASAPVYIKGYKAGKVTDVIYEPSEDKFYVTCSVSKQFAVPADSKMMIYSVDIMGGKGVRLDLGDAVEMAADGDTLASGFEAGLMDGLSSEIGPLLSKVGMAVDSLSVTISGVNGILTEKNRSRISNSLANLEHTLANVKDISANIDGKSEQIDVFIDNLAALSTQLGALVAKADSTMAGASKFVDSVNEADIAGTVESLKRLVDNINNPDGSVGRLLTEDDVYNSVDSLLSDIDELISKIKENPKKYLKISVF